MKRLIATLITLFSLSSAIADEDASASIQSVIVSQLTALKNNDGAGAWQHAHPSIKAQFGTPERFMSMVQNGYLPLIEFTQMAFGALELEDGIWLQPVSLEDDSGQWYDLIYVLIESQPNVFQISGVSLELSQGI